MTCPPCHGDCRQSRECPAHTDEREPADPPITTPEEAGAWTCISQVVLIAIVVLCLAAAFIQIVLPPLYR